MMTEELKRLEAEIDRQQELKIEIMQTEIDRLRALVQELRDMLPH